MRPCRSAPARRSFQCAISSSVRGPFDPKRTSRLAEEYALGVFVIQVGKNTNSATSSVGVLSTDAMHISMTHRHADNNMPVMVIDNPLRNIQMNFGLSLFKIALGICTNRLSGEARNCLL